MDGNCSGEISVVNVNNDKGFSLGKVASYCGVTRKTILRWVQDGLIDSFALPSGHHRVTRTALVEFLRSNDMPVPGDLQTREKKSILVVDDDPNIRRIITDLFKPHFLVSEAKNGVEACIAMGANPPDMLFLDNRMPYMDGVEVCRQLRGHEKLKNMKIVIVSAHLNSESYGALMNMADKIIRKPFKPVELVDTALELAAQRPQS